MYCGPFLTSHGPAGLVLSSTLTFTFSWHSAEQEWPQARGLLQGSRQRGHGPKWQLCAVAGPECPHLAGTEHMARHRGGLTAFSRPQGTETVVRPQLQEMVCCSWQG